MSQAASPRDVPDVAPMVAVVGTTVRSLRKDRALTLDQLAERSSLSVGVVSQLERGIGNPSFATLVQLAHGLDVPVGRLLLINESSSPVVRADERKRIDGHGMRSERVSYEMLTPNLSGQIGATLVTSQPGHDTSATPFRHNGEEFGIVLSGQLEVYIDGTRHQLFAGDSILFSSTVPHWFVNPGPEDTTAIWVNTPPSW
ncbi:XRE family transcriptional regulator [Allokutzneria sp. A3M-2-11 16]|uniref:helix-turn-helix domain-containing protein n=1 Tax=Allokutzneria sp. A3M-2-11 16 TaxID=2962043 RepID=UPI0020B64607|nr:XRE family transcriptional regulator [Allokutzneria sp. A3M-2-11 16]MCP3801980.1 XRE family transcriptional regulator [Allokutzneria sp. A3M-2-11 16]